MDGWREHAFGALLRLLPHSARSRDAAELRQAWRACLDRDRRRRGRAGTASAWIHIVADTLAAAIALRLDARRARRVAALRPPPVTGDDVVTQLWQDLRYALRVLRRTPLFSAVVIVTLALATGATTALFGVVDTVLIKPLPFAEPDRLVMVYQAIPTAIARPIGFSAPDYGAFEQRATSYASVAAFRSREYELAGIDQPERVMALRASASLFATLGVDPRIGRPFTREEDEGSQPVAILSAALWRRSFAADPAVVGRAITLDRRPYTIVGVMPDGFTFPNRGPVLNNIPADVYLPVSFTDHERAAFGSMYNNSVVARLKAGVSVSQAQAEAKEVVRAAAAENYPAALTELAGALSASVTPLREETVGRVQTTITVLFAAMAVVLLIACADLANLLLTRASSRRREMAVRSALGAGRARLIRQSLAESMLLALAGSALGLVVAKWVTAVLVRAAPPTIPRLHEIGFDLRVLLFAATLSVVVAILCGLLPAIEASRRESSDALKEGGRSGAPGRRQRRLFDALVTAQFAMAVVLLIAGGLLVRSFARLTAVDPGFQPEHVLTFATSLPANAYPGGAEVRGFYTRLLDRVAALPGATAAAASTDLPLGIRERRAFTFESEPEEPRRSVPRTVAHDWVLGDYFGTMGIALKRGRHLSAADTATSEPVLVINETMRRTYWGDADPVGQRVAWGNPASRSRWMRIVGVVADVKQGPLNSETVPQTYQPWLQVNDSLLGENLVGALRSLRVSVRSELPPSSLSPAVRAQIHALDPSLPVTAVQTLDDIVRSSAAPQRFNTLLLSSFAALALLLAALGVGGVLATSISRRTQEFGLRMALGAQRSTVLWMVLRQGFGLALAGLVLGLPAAFGLTRLMSTLLFEVSPRDPLTFASVAVLLLAVGLAASYVPARRATGIDPIAALRED